MKVLSSLHCPQFVSTIACTISNSAVPFAVLAFSNFAGFFARQYLLTHGASNYKDNLLKDLAQNCIEGNVFCHWLAEKASEEQTLIKYINPSVIENESKIFGDCVAVTTCIALNILACAYFHRSRKPQAV